MKTTVSRLAIGCTLAALSISAAAQAPAPGPDMIVVRPTAKAPEEVVGAIKAYAEGKKWLYMGATKAKQGQVTMVKVCIPQVGKLLWPLGLHLSALLPCGNVGVYQKQGKTEISMLHPAYMQVLYPDATVAKAVGIATPLLMGMLEDVAK
jgi:hypothetical protein